MFILGIDVGTRNLGLCIIEKPSGPLSTHCVMVHRWVNVDLFPNSKNVNKIELGRLMTSVVDTVWEMVHGARRLAGLMPLAIAIERQPNCNPRMKAVGASVFSACYVFTKTDVQCTVHYVSAGKKFQVHEASCVNRKALDDSAATKKATARERYAANKKDGIMTVRHLIGSGALEFRDELGAAGFEASRKKDDLADSLLIALSY